MTTPAEIRKLLARLDGEPADALEDETLEFKTWDQDPSERKRYLRELREAVVCLANQRGGTIVLGVRDGVRTRGQALTGIGHVDLESLRREIYGGTEPHILVEIHELKEPEARLAIVQVPRGFPPHTTTDGKASIRVGKECKPLTGSSLRQLLLSRGDVDFTSRLLTGATADDLDPEHIATLKRQLATDGGKPEFGRAGTGKVLASLGLVRDNTPTLAAVLLLGRAQALTRFAPQHEVQLLRFGKRRTRPENQQSLRGPLLAVLEALRRVLNAHLNLLTAPTDGFSELSLPDITWVAAREAVLNALVHRDWFLNQSVQIELREDRLVVASPGGFPLGVTPDNVLRHPPVRRNPLLAEVFQQMGFVNRAGLGVDRIYEEMLRLGKGLPRYEADEAHVRLTLSVSSHAPFARVVAEEARAGRTLELDDLILLRALVDMGRLDRWSGAKHLQLPEDEAAERLTSLRERGFLVPIGRGRGTAYRLHPRHSDLLRGRTETDLDLPFDDEAVRLRVQAVLAERQRLTNADIRRISGYSRPAAIRLMQSLRESGLARLVGRGRSAHWVAAASRSNASGPRRKKKRSG